MPFDNDWYRPVFTIPDVMPHGAGTARRPVPSISELQSGVSSDDSGGDPLQSEITSPGGRPIVFQQAQNLSFVVGTTPLSITPNRTICDTIIVDCPSSAINSVFFGFGSGISTGSGLEVRAGFPLVFSPDNTREMWELQRQLEFIAALMSSSLQVPSLPIYRAPRVVLDASDYFLVASASTAISIMLLYLPEFQ